MSNKLTYPDLLETNNLLQNHGEETYWLCVTRTVPAVLHQRLLSLADTTAKD